MLFNSFEESNYNHTIIHYKFLIYVVKLLLEVLWDLAALTQALQRHTDVSSTSMLVLGWSLQATS